MTFLTIVVVAANILGGAMAVPQARKLLRTRRVVGVSLIWAAIGATVNAWWGVYGFAVDDPAIVPVSAVSVTVYLVIAGVVVRSSSAPARRTVPAAFGASAAVSVVPVAALAIDGWLITGVALGALYGVQLAPAVVAVYRTADVSGVSQATWIIAFVEASLWGVYGFSGRDLGLVTLATTGVVMSSLVLARLFVRRPRHGRELAPAGLPGFATA